tara:strand:- start:142 stop:273 length:132 start_codon:yes stop_codon:yes gene_type:complete
VKAREMLILTNMLAKIISDVDDLKEMIRKKTFEDFEENFVEEE